MWRDDGPASASMQDADQSPERNHMRTRMIPDRQPVKRQKQSLQSDNEWDCSKQCNIWEACCIMQDRHGDYLCPRTWRKVAKSAAATAAKTPKRASLFSIAP